MSSEKNRSYHVVPHMKGGWTVRKEGSHRASKRFDEKTPAVDWAKQASKKRGVRLYIHDNYGRVEERKTYV